MHFSIIQTIEAAIQFLSIEVQKCIKATKGANARPAMMGYFSRKGCGQNTWHSDLNWVWFMIR